MGLRILRVSIGLLVGPVLPCLLASFLLGNSTLETALHDAWSLIVMSWLLSIILALPAYLALQKSGYVCPVKSLCSGFIIGFATSATVAFLGAHGWNIHEVRHALWACLVFGALGSAIGLAFWVVAFWTPTYPRF